MFIGHEEEDCQPTDLASNPGLPDFISQPIFLHGCEIKSGRERPGFEATTDQPGPFGQPEECVL